MNPTVSEDNNKISWLWITKKDGKTNEYCFNFNSTQQGKDVLVKGDVVSTVRGNDGKVIKSDQINVKEFNLVLHRVISNVKKCFNGWYRFGYDSTKNSEGLIITKVAPGFPFEKRGIKEGDIIVSINGTQLPCDPGLFEKILDPFSADAKDFVIKRNGETNKYTIKPKYESPEEAKKRYAN